MLPTKLHAYLNNMITSINNIAWQHLHVCGNKMITSISNTSMVPFARMPQQHGQDCVPHWHMHECAHLNKMGRSIKDGLAGKCPLLHGLLRKGFSQNFPGKFTNLL